jgi:hypothetical protein
MRKCVGPLCAQLAEAAQAKIGADVAVLQVMISSDKAQVTNFGQRAMYPIYMTLGNIHKNHRSSPISKAIRLLGYLPVPHCEQADIIPAVPDHD